jgi:geranylgeranyl diphosphate synthase type II
MDPISAAPPPLPSAGGTPLLNFDLQAYLSRQRQKIESALQETLAATAFAGATVVAAMRYSLEAGGKRLRPILCMATAEAVGGVPDDTLPACIALEMIHTYSLIHDDLPAMDNDDLRRGKPTCHVAFDEATAILAGDALLTQAFEVLAEAGLAEAPAKARRWMTVMRLLASAAGCDGMIEGQMRDMAGEGRPMSREAMESMHALKTGALIRAAVRSGAVLGGVVEGHQELLDRYARGIGLAFQITDDILNVEGDPRLMGKAVGSDAERGKSTYPQLLGLTESRRLAAELIQDALKALEVFDRKADPLRGIALYVTQRRR